MSDFLHEFDPSGNNPDNLISGESHSLEDATALILVPVNGLFYTKSLTVRKMSNNTVMVLGTDYTYQGFDAEITALTGLECCAAIAFLNPAITGAIELTYQCVGGKEGMLNAWINDLRKRIAWLNSQNVTWNDIINKPLEYPPEDHTHDLLTDFSNFAALRTAMERIIAALESARVPVLSGAALSLRIDRIIDLLTIQRRDLNTIAAKAIQPFNIIEITATVVLDTVTNGDVYLLNCSTAESLTVPLISSLSNHVKLHFTNMNTGNVAITATGANQIRNGTTDQQLIIVPAGGQLTLVSRVNRWFII